MSDKLREMIGRVEDPDLRDEMLRELDRHDLPESTQKVKYTMRAFRSRKVIESGARVEGNAVMWPPGEPVLWVAEGAPDFEGKQSPYPPEELSDIIVIQVSPDPFDALKDRKILVPKELGDRRDYHLRRLNQNRTGEDE